MFTQQLLRKLKPYFAESIRIAITMSSGDLLAQRLVENRQYSNLDFKRTFKFACVGFVIVGPILHYWFGLLDQLVPKNEKPIIRGFKKMSIDQMLFTPIFSIVIISSLGFLNGDTVRVVNERLKENYFEIMLRSFLFWPAVQMFNFTMVPQYFQVLFVQTCGVFWNCYISLKLNKESNF